MRHSDYCYCPFRVHNGPLMECNWCDALCKRNSCPYFPTLDDANAAYKKRWEAVGEILHPTVEEMKKKP